MLLAETEHGLSGLDPSSCHNRRTFVLAIIFAPAAFAVATHFTTSRQVLVLVDKAIAANIYLSVVIVLCIRKCKSSINRRVSA